MKIILTSLEGRQASIRAVKALRRPFEVDYTGAPPADLPPARMGIRDAKYMAIDVATGHPRSVEVESFAEAEFLRAAGFHYTIPEDARSGFFVRNLSPGDVSVVTILIRRLGGTIETSF